MKKSSKFPIVGIGASAGGIEAMEGFFRGMPEAPGVGFVVVTHLKPDRQSYLREVIQRFTALPVLTAVAGATVERDHVYVMPAGSVLLIEQGNLQFAPATDQRERKPIDVFFSALAVDQGEYSAGVVLSGGDGDGTLGLKAIKEHAGLTLAQIKDGFGPQHPDMPAAAISSGLVDFAVPVEEMGAKLRDFADMLDRMAEDLSSGTGDSREFSDALPSIYGLLRSQVGHDFSGYKVRTFIRRVQRRMQVSQLNDVNAYTEKLRQEPTEVATLFRDLLINVTSFFRDEDAFKSLAETVIPRLFSGRGADETVRIWVPGCATGEEVYSIGMLIREHTERLSSVPRVQIFATDIDERALSVARAARYPLPLLDGVSEERKRKYFVADGNSLVVSKDVRELCIFSPHSLIRDPPFSRIDLVSCRNLLIYFGPDVQSQVIPTFHYALRPEGYLFLGTAENVSQFDDLFQSVEKRQRIFRRRTDAGVAPRLPLRLDAARSAQFNDMMPRRTQLHGASLRQAVDHQVLERHSPPHVVVNQDGDVMYYSGRTGKYLEAPAGAPTRQLQTIARKDLRLDLRTLFREAVETGRLAVRESVPVGTDDGRVQLVCLTIEPISDHGASELLFLVLFTDQGPLLSREDALERASFSHGGSALNAERELRDTRDRLQSMIEEYETALEELKSSNEELVSLNEEMQSTNEELEASKEELQSVNEELHTVNAELHGKVEALDHANSDLLNLFDSTDVATIFLDRDLVIRSFTPAVTRVFAIRPGDRGRPLTDLSARISLDDLASDILSVFQGHAPIERRADGHDPAANYLVRVAPYRSGHNRVEGVVVTFIDVTTLSQAEGRQILLIAELQHRTRNLLGLIQSIAHRTMSDCGTLNEFSDRLSALARAQSLLGGHLRENVELADLVALELRATGAPQARIVTEGPAVVLGFEMVQTICLALHELATNAVKHGALHADAEHGRLEVRWSLDEQGVDAPCMLKLQWRESGVRIPAPPQRKGFGRELIEKSLAYTLDASTHLEFTPEGAVCNIEMAVPRRPSGPALDVPNHPHPH